MVNKNNRNSRDDKSKSSSRRTAENSGSSESGKRKRIDGERKFSNNSDQKDGYSAKPYGSKNFKSKTTDQKYKSKNEETESFTFGERTFKAKDSGTKAGGFKEKSSQARDFKPRGRQRDFNAKDGDSRDFKSKDGDRNYKTNRKTDGFKPSAGSSRDVKPRNPKDGDVRPFRKREELKGEKTFHRPERTVVAKTQKTYDDKGLIRLNRYISNAGICSRRKADELIAAGIITVNGEAVTELGHKVDPAKDLVRYNGELLKREKKVYVLLNKPKDYITTTDDPQERRTVMQLVEKASKERIYPVGRLDRNTTGLLLMTNDGDLADKLSHPKNGITKIYHVELNKSLSQGDLNKIAFGLELEDGLIKPDNISYVAGGTKKEIGIQIHSGKNRIVRRIFEHLGYSVEKLDRVVYGNLTKKDLPRGRWRYLEEHELVQIKHLIK